MDKIVAVSVPMFALTMLLHHSLRNNLYRFMNMGSVTGWIYRQLRFFVNAIKNLMAVGH